MAERNGDDFRRLLWSAERLRERAMPPADNLKTRSSRSRASLRAVTAADQVRRVAIRFDLSVDGRILTTGTRASAVAGALGLRGQRRAGHRLPAFVAQSLQRGAAPLERRSLGRPLVLTELIGPFGRAPRPLARLSRLGRFERDGTFCNSWNTFLRWLR